MPPKRNGPLVIPKYQVDNTDFSWLGKPPDASDPGIRFLPVLWNQKNLKFINGNFALNYAGTSGRPKFGHVIRIPRAVVGMPFQMYNDFKAGYLAEIDRVGLLISDQIFPTGEGWNLLTQACLFDHDGVPVPPEHYVGGELYAVTQLDIHAQHYDTFFTTKHDSFTYDAYRPIVVELPNGQKVFQGWEPFQTNTWASTAFIEGPTLEMPGLARDVSLIKASLKRFSRVRMVIGNPPQTLRHYTAVSGVSGPHFLDLPFPNDGLPPLPSDGSGGQYISSDSILTGPSPTFPNDPTLEHYWYELGFVDPLRYSNQESIDQYIALVNKAAGEIGAECVVIDMDLDVEDAIQEDIATFFGLN